MVNGLQAVTKENEELIAIISKVSLLPTKIKSLYPEFRNSRPFWSDLEN